MKILDRYETRVVFECDDTPEMLAMSLGERKGHAVRLALAANVSLIGADLRGTDFAGERIIHANFTNCFMDNTQFTGSDLYMCDMTGVSMRGAKADEADLTYCTFDGALVSNSSFVETILSNTKFHGTALRGSSFRRASMRHASLVGAMCTSVDFQDANLEYADFSKADLDRTDFTNARLEDAHFHQADLNYTKGVIDGGQRSDGFRFTGWKNGETLWIHAGCRDFTITRARTHWQTTRGGTPLGRESLAMLRLIREKAKIEWPDLK